LRPDEPQLRRGLTLTDAVALVIGTVIGTGVFLKAAVMAQDVGTPGLVLAAWVAAGVLSMAGALTYAELGGLFPHAGGEYVYLREAYGDGPAFLFGWMRFTVASTGSIAILAVGFATFLAAVVPLNEVWASSDFQLLGQTIHWQFGSKQIVAVVAILVFSAVNCLDVVFGGRVQSVLTALKVLGIAVIVGGVFFFADGADWSHLAAPAGSDWGTLAGFGAAMVGALWAFDGWNNLPMAAGEVKDAERNVPRALIIGLIALTLIYCITNLAYFYALPFEEVRTANSTAHPGALPVATKAAQTFLGSGGQELIAIALILSALGALSGNILTGARVPFAMARDGLFFSKCGTLSASTHVPVAAIWLQAVWASVLAVSAAFDQLTDFVVFGSFIFYGLTTAALFVLRRKMPDTPRPYRTLGYPLVPVLFLAVVVWLLINTLVEKPVESVAGLVLIALGLPLYVFYRHRVALAALTGRR
jgi:basic amino acid/polyamine antiporter, APA family